MFLRKRFRYGSGMRTLRCLFLCAFTMTLPLLHGCGGGSATVSVPSPTTPVAVTRPAIWVGAWGDSMTNAEPETDNTGSSEQSFRFLITPTVGGTQERVRFSNVYGLTPVTLGSAHLSIGQDGSAAVDATHDVALQFSGQPGVTIAPGQVVVSDPVSLTFSFGQTLAISMYLKGSFGPVSRHNSLFITNYRSAAGTGDKTGDTAGTGFTEHLGDWLLINGVDVYGSQYGGTIALFGSSTTDGLGSNYSSDQVYPTRNVPVAGQHSNRLGDWLARRLNAAGYQIGVVNEGISGDTVTDDSTNQTFHVKNANQRIAQDVLTLPNLLGMVTYFGSIDIRSPDCKSAPAIEEATQRLLATAHTAGVPVILATVPPSAFCTNAAQPNFGPTPTAADPYAGGSPATQNGGELQRMAFNTWIRQTGAGLAGVAGIADFDLALKDPNRPGFLQAPYNSGDNYHPTGAGYQAESLVIPFSVLLKP